MEYVMRMRPPFHTRSQKGFVPTASRQSSYQRQLPVHGNGMGIRRWMMKERVSKYWTVHRRVACGVMRFTERARVLLCACPQKLRVSLRRHRSGHVAG